METDALQKVKSLILTASVSQSLAIALHELRVPLTQLQAVVALLQKSPACNQYNNDLDILANKVSSLWAELDSLLEYLHSFYQMEETKEPVASVVTYARQTLDALEDVESSIMEQTHMLKATALPLLNACYGAVSSDLQRVVDIAVRAIRAWREMLEPILRQALRSRLQRAVYTSSLS